METTKSEGVCIEIATFLLKMHDEAMSNLEFNTAKNYLEVILILINVVEKNNFFNSSEVKDFYQRLKEYSENNIKYLKETIEELDKLLKN